MPDFAALREQMSDAERRAWRPALCGLECCSDRGVAPPSGHVGSRSPELVRKTVDRLLPLRLSLEPGMENRKQGLIKPETFSLALTLEQLRGVDIVPGVESHQCLMISHVAAQRCHGDAALFDRLIVSAFSRALLEILFTDPEIRLTSRVNMFTDHRARILDSLPRHAYTLNLAARKVDV